MVEVVVVVGVLGKLLACAVVVATLQTNALATDRKRYEAAPSKARYKSTSA